jgi:hypothetical protein
MEVREHLVNNIRFSSAQLLFINVLGSCTLDNDKTSTYRKYQIEFKPRVSKQRPARLYYVARGQMC